jgi:cyanophycinase
MNHPARLLHFLLVAGTLAFTRPAEARSGQLVIIGGGSPNPSILQKFVELAGPGTTILVLPMASAERDSGKAACDALLKNGAHSAQVLALTRQAADSPTAIEPLRHAAAIFFTGGDQSRLTAVLKGTQAEALLHERFEGGAVLAGTSAGAAVMSEIMITGAERRPDADTKDPWTTIEAEDVVTAPGLGFLPGVIVDQHFIKRRRNNRLLSLVLEDPTALGVGIDEQTAIWVRPDRTFEVLGVGAVVVFDARGASVRKDGPGLEADGVSLHVLRAGSLFDMASRHVVRLGK